jgi:UPF0042 nucleotide-binding protein
MTDSDRTPTIDEAPRREEAGRIVLVTGLAGAGRTTALRALEDMGFEAVDNLPTALLDQLLRSGERILRDLAIGMDYRSHDFDPTELQRRALHGDRMFGTEVKILFLDCDDEILGRRFTETRRRHPLAPDRAVADGISRERTLMAPLKASADLIIDTSRLSVHELRNLLSGHFDRPGRHHLLVSIVSFSYRHGLPREADLVFDVRFLANPHYDERLRPLTGIDPAVQAHIEADPQFHSLMENLDRLLQPLLPAYQREGKSYLTIAFGCTGGRHRSVTLAERFAAQLDAAGWSVRVHHRDTPDANRGARLASGAARRATTS